jgi:hypothetical protein
MGGSPSRWFLGWEQGFEPLPLLIRQVSSVHTQEYTAQNRVCKHALVTVRVVVAGQVISVHSTPTDAAGNATVSRASGPRWPRVRENAWPMISVCPSQGDFCVTASHRFCGTVVAETCR